MRTSTYSYYVSILFTILFLGLLIPVNNHAKEDGVLDFKPDKLLPPNTKSTNCDTKIRLDPTKDENLIVAVIPKSKNKEGYKLDIIIKVDDKGKFAGLDPEIWCNGAIHEFVKPISIAGYKFEPDKDRILTFKVDIKKGYVFVSGFGKVETPNNRIVKLDDTKKGMVFGKPVFLSRLEDIINRMYQKTIKFLKYLFGA